MRWLGVPLHVVGIVVLLAVPAVFGVVAVRRGYRGRLLLLAAGWFGAALVLLPLLLMRALLTDEGDLPPDDLSSRLPPGLAVVARTQGCGSGGCWREYTVRDSDRPEAAPVAAAEQLRASGLEGCRRSIWSPDLRRRCTDVTTRGGSVLVSVHLQGP